VIDAPRGSTRLRAVGDDQADGAIRSTLLPESGAPDDVYDALRPVFAEEEIVALTLAIGLINVWNRLSVGFRRPAGDYVSRRRPA
jgi:alkylhydroperoxidase family enzyme